MSNKEYSEKASYHGAFSFLKSQKLQSEIEKLIHPEDASKRRVGLIKDMVSRVEKFGDCSNCRGTCCTFEANSMKISPLEALEILYHFGHMLDFEQLWEVLEKNRLFDGGQEYKGRILTRKTYTCNFFSPGFKGCALALEFKPLGCLSFNPEVPEQTAGGECSLRSGRLEEVRKKWSNVNQNIREKLELDWEKDYIPVALAKCCQSLFLKKA